MALVLLFLSGCTTDPDNGKENEVVEIDSTGDCIEENLLVYSNSWETVDVVDRFEGSDTFELPNGTQHILMTGTSGSFVQARWSFSLVDADMEEFYTWQVTAPVTAVGENNNVPDEKILASVGQYYLNWEIEGVITSLTLNIAAVTCA